jgi:MSP (Major sperm protein) domain
VFALTNDDTAPQCVLRLTNALEDNVVAFKVKTTKPKRYLVKPNQGLVQPSESEPISIQLLAPEKKVILSDYAASGAWDDSNKFLVQSVVLSSDFLEQYNAASAKDQTQLVRQ